MMDNTHVESIITYAGYRHMMKYRGSLWYFWSVSKRKWSVLDRMSPLGKQLYV